MSIKRIAIVSSLLFILMCIIIFFIYGEKRYKEGLKQGKATCCNETVQTPFSEHKQEKPFVITHANRDTLMFLISKIESNHNFDAIGSSGERTNYQIMPIHVRETERITGLSFPDNVLEKQETTDLYMIVFLSLCEGMTIEEFCYKKWRPYNKVNWLNKFYKYYNDYSD
jgi:hypothetical protein